MSRVTTESHGKHGRNGPLLYRITVRGAVPTRWRDRLGGLRIDAVRTGLSTLEGEIADPAALAGVLDTLCQLGLTILEVRTVPTSQGEGTSA